MGIALGILLIVINSVVGIFVINVLTYEEEIELDAGLSLPQIHFQDYEVVRDDYQHRLERDFITPSPKDPFSTGELIQTEQ